MKLFSVETSYPFVSYANKEWNDLKTEPCQALQTIREREMGTLNLRGTFLFKYTKHDNLANVHLF